MPTLSKTTLVNALVDRTRTALVAADQDGDNAVSPQERATLPQDVRTLADSVADYYFEGGELPIAQYVPAYRSYVQDAANRADRNRDNKLQTAEQRSLPSAVYSSVTALLAGQSTPTPQPPAPVTPPPSTGPTSGAGVLGISGTMGPSSISMRNVVSSGLNTPTGIAFNPHDGSLWILNRGDDSSVRVSNPTANSPSKQKFYDDSNHFMNNPMGLAFSPVYNEFASVQETTNDYNTGDHGNMFMGPTLWPADSSYDGGQATHLDMLHHSPNAMGITAGTAYPNRREYWVFNGQHGSIDRYLFGEPHVPGGDDHADGLTIRYSAGSLKRRAGVPSHMALDSGTGTLYVADTGNRRIAKLNTNLSLNNATAISGHHDETPLYNVPSSSVSGVTGTGQLVAPSGLLIHQNHLVVSDYATGHVKVFTKTGSLVGDLDTGLGANSITGIAVGPNGKLFAADAKANKVVEITIGN